MDRGKYTNLKMYFRENRLKMVSLTALAILSALLVIAAIKMLPFPQSAGTGGNKQDASSSISNENTRQTDKNPKGRENGNSAASPAVTGDEPSSLPGDNYFPSTGGSIEGYLNEKIRKKFPDISIDLSKDKNVPRLPSLDDDSYVLKSGRKMPHTPVVEVLGNMKSPFLKLAVMENYSSNQWKTPRNPNFLLYEDGNNIGMNSVKIKPVSPSKGFIPMLSNYQTVRFPQDDIVSFPGMGIFYTDKEIIDEYEVFYNEPVPTDGILKNAKTDTGSIDDIKVSAGILTLAGNIVKGTDSSYGKIKAIENYLKRNYKYGVSEDKSTPDMDAINKFLFVSKKGTRLDFVSAFVILLRSAKIQAHIVTGYKVNPFKNYQIVYADQLTVYPEVKFEEYGWVPLDVFNYNFFVPPVGTMTRITSVDPLVKKGATFNVKGKVIDQKGKPVNGLPVFIYVKKSKNEDALAYFKGSVSKGTFNITCDLKSDIDVGKYQVVACTLENESFKSSWSDPEMKVVAETALSLDTKEVIFEGTTLTISGRLYEVLSGSPVIHGQVNIQPDNRTVTSNASNQSALYGGTFTCKMEPIVNRESHPQLNLYAAAKYTGNFTVNYRGSDLYLPCEKTVSVGMWVIFWNRVIILLMVLLLGVLLSVCLSKAVKGRRIKQLALLLDAELSHGFDEFEMNHEVLHRKEKNQAVHIVFPQIGPAFPDVWGLDESLTVRFSEDTGDFSEMDVMFDQKGQKMIRVFSTGHHEFRGMRGIRIVYYREEVIRMGKRFFEKLCRKYFTLNIKHTSRELIDNIPGELDETVCRKLDEMLLLFEKATYSFDIIDRHDYEAFYSLITSIDSVIFGEEDHEPKQRKG